MSIAVDRDQAFLDAVSRIAAEVAAPNADDVDREARFPRESIEALRAERALSAFVPEELGGGGVSFEAIAARLLRARPPLRRQRDGLRDAPDPGGDDRPPPRGRRLVRGLPARDRRRPAAGRLGHLRGRHRRRHGSLGRRRHPGGRRRRSFEKQAPTVSYGEYADDLLHHPAPQPRGRARRPGPGADPQGPALARADRHLGPARDARHLLARLRRPRRSSRPSRC